jgi:hypothetical protein
MSEQIGLDPKQQAVVDILREDLEAVIQRAQEIQSHIVFTVMTFAGVDKDQWDDWEVSLGSPTVVRRRETAPNPIKEVVDDE